MEETQAIDFADFPLEDDFAPAADIGTDQVVGALEVVSQTADSFPLHLGLNVVGRGSSNQAGHQGLLDKWKGEHTGIPVHGIFLQSNSISSSHAAIYIESGGAVCFIKDLGSRNKTMLGRAGGLTVLQANGDRYSVLQGDKLRFGNVDTVISYSTVHAQATTGMHAQLAAVQDTNLQATEPQRIVDRSPTPEMANANANLLSAPVPNTDNDMTLPWDDAPAYQQDDQPEADDNSQGAAMNNETQAVEPLFAETEQQAAATNLLPDTQVNEVPSERPHASVLASHQQAAILGSAARSSQDRQTAPPAQSSGSLHVPVAEPTQLVGEPTQLAFPLGPSSGPVGTSSGPQAGTALASAAAQAMTGAQPTQASLLPSSAGFSTGMPSLAPVNDPPAAVASATPALGAEAAASAGQTAGSLPISRPQADAVLHLPSQPSGSQHAAHPHGPPTRIPAAAAAAGMSTATAGGEQSGSKPSQSQQAPQALPAGFGVTEQGPSEEQMPEAEADVGTVQAAGSHPAPASSGRNTLLDSVLGHDDDDSIWMPPASMPGSEGPSQEAEPAVLPPTRGQDLPLQSALLSSGEAQDHAGTTASAAAARQPSDSNQTQDSQPEAQEEVQQPAAPAPEEPAAVASPARQGRHGRGPAPADQGMYTGAFAFPDSASLGMSQPALDLPVPRGSKLPAAAATQGKASGQAAAAPKTGVISRAPAESAGVPKKAAAGKKAVPAKADEGKAVARVVPSAWKAKKADPVVEQPVEAIKTGTPPEEAKEVVEVKKPSRQLPKPIMHEPDKLSPWRVRGTPLGGGAAPSQLPDTEDVNAAMAAAGQMAAFFPATQAEPETNADTDAVVSAPLPTSAFQIKAADGPTQENSDSWQGSKAQQNKKNGTMTAAASAAAGSGEEEQASAAKAAQRSSTDDGAKVKSRQTKKGSDAKKPAPAAATGALAGGDTPQQVSDGAAAEHVARGQQEAGSLQQEEEVQAPIAAAGRGRGRGKGRASVSTRASVDADEEEGAGKRKAKRGQGSAGAGARGGSRGRGRGRKASGQGAAAKGPLPTSAADSDVTDMDIDTEKPKAGAAKSKRQRSVGREGSPAVEGSRVSKRQKAKADAQAAEAAQLQEAEEQAAEEDDPFSGAATQAAAGALEELRRSATPEDEQGAEEAAALMLVPTRKGKRSRITHPADASASSEAAAVAAAAALAEGPADTAQKPGGQSTTLPARTHRLSAKGRPAASKTDSADLGSERSSGGNAELATASGQSKASGSSIAAGAGVQSQPEAAVDDAEQQQGRRQSGSKGRGKSRLFRASSPVEAPTVESEPDALPVKRRTIIKRSAAEGTAAGADPVRKRRSGTASSAAQAGAAEEDVSAHVQVEPRSSTADKAPANTGTSAKGSGARRKSAPGTGPEAAPAASETAAGSSRRGSRGRAASQGVDAVAVAEVAAVPAGRAKRSRPGSNVLPDVSASEADAADDVEEAGPSSSRVEEGAAGGAGGEGTGHDPAKGPSGPKASKGKRQRQDMAEAEEDGPASHVKAARKATDNKQVRVLYSTTLDKSKKASMTKIVKRLGGSVEDKEGPEFTHFVTLQPTSPGQTDRGFKKSINALIALAAGRPIVSDSWIDACGRSGSFVDPIDHLLLDTAAQKKFAFDMRTSYERAQHQLLLTGLHVFFTPGMLAAESDKGTNIQNLVGHAGGVVETQLPESVSGKDAKLSSQWLLIAHEKDIKREQKWSKGKVASKMPFHGRTMLIDSIMQQTLDRKHGMLFTT